MSFQNPITAMTLQDVQEWARQQGNTDYANAVARFPKLTDGTPLSQAPADLLMIKRALPLQGFDPARSKSEAAYKATRRKIIAAVKGATGEIEAAQERRCRTDAWSMLMERMEARAPALCAKGGHPPFVMVPVRKLADLARQHRVEPRDVSQDWLSTLIPVLDQNEWRALQHALRTLNRARSFSEILALLPTEPFSAPKRRRFENQDLIPPHLASEIEDWVANATCAEFDPVEQEFVKTSSKSDRDFKRAALRKFVSTLFQCGAVAADCQQSLGDLLTPDAGAAAVRYWSMHAGQSGHISARSAHDYMKANFVIMARNGLNPDPIKAHLRSNRFLTQGKRASGEMSERSRKFCENLLGSTRQTMTFLSLHVRFRNDAEELLRQISDQGRVPTSLELNRIRQLGTVAALCAIETRGAPLRIESALNLVYRGPKATFLLPTAQTQHATIKLSPEHTKNNVEIWAPIAPGNLNGLETILWYLERIRPLYADNDTCSHLFPGVRGRGPLLYRTFLIWFKRLTRAAGIPMTPHKFRHGLASLLLQKNPGRWDLLERLLDDTPGTIRKNYAWVNARAQREEVQKYVLDLSEIRR
ncbi:tyrosine-type recombinase/integrase [Sedimentimonas flavescens]|uniref:Tyrosine-type recombinase/integrase n=1 Tax=Sedimentimonas flavescens TaxID=2851012 RepID=A0ABT3A021_9RHOB|nr:tyrosine-type recombinase/integrase [Sedimentimonas flavescens]MCV2879310.1 tyrosine-type recombinase/integrase [Sedimentimonas flavescens]